MTGPRYPHPMPVARLHQEIVFDQHVVVGNGDNLFLSWDGKVTLQRKGSDVVEEVRATIKTYPE